MFEFLKTGIDGLDAILGGGIRYPAESSAFVFATGGAGSGKTILALEMLTRAWLTGEDGTTFLYYSVEHSPRNLFAKLKADFDFFGTDCEITELEQEVPHKICLEARTPKGCTRMVLTQADGRQITVMYLPNETLAKTEEFTVDQVPARMDRTPIGVDALAMEQPVEWSTSDGKLRIPRIEFAKVK